MSQASQFTPTDPTGQVARTIEAGQGAPAVQTSPPPPTTQCDPTSPDPQTQAYRSMTPAQRVDAGCALHDFALERLRIHLRRQHPDLSESQIAVLVARRFLGDAARVL